MLPGFFFDTVGSGIREQQKDAAAKAERDQQRELEILQILSQHGSDDVRGVAGTQWLELANNPNRPRAKGLGGFLGQTEKSPYFKDIQTAISSAKIAQGPQPPSAGMSTNAPVSPGSSPISPAPAGPPSQFSDLQTIKQPEPERIQSATPGTSVDATGQLAIQGAPAGPAAAPGGPQGMGGLPPIPTAPLVPPPPPPPKIRSLFPDAKEIAQHKAEEQTILQQAKEDQIAQSILKYGGTNQQVLDTLQSSHGNPPRRGINSIPMMLTVNGQEVAGSYEPDTDRYTVGGQVVQPTSWRRTNLPQGRPPIKSYDEDGTLRLIDADSGQVLHTIPNVGKPQIPPPAFSGGGVILDENGNPIVTQFPRGGGAPVKKGDAPPHAGQVSDQQREYKAWLAVVDKNLSAASKNLLGKTKPLTDVQRDTEAAKVSGGKVRSYHELQVGAQGGKVQQRGKSGLNPDEFRDVLNGIAKDFKGQQSGTVQGSAPPITPAPPPPK